MTPSMCQEQGCGNPTENNALRCKPCKNKHKRVKYRQNTARRKAPRKAARKALNAFYAGAERVSEAEAFRRGQIKGMSVVAGSAKNASYTRSLHANK